MKYGLLIGGIIVILWAIFGYYIFRWSPDRIKGIIAVKYSLIYEKKYPNYIITVADVRVSPSKDRVSFTVVMKDKDTLETAKQFTKSYDIVTNADDCGVATDGCIVV